MSDVMTRGVIGMPFEMAMDDHLSRLQFHSRAQSLLAENESLRAEVEALKQDRRELQGEGKHPAPCARYCESVAFYSEISSLKSRAEKAEAALAECKSLLGQVSAVAITMLYDSHRDDVLAAFSMDELAEVVSICDPSREAGLRVEHVYRKGFDAARAK